MFIPDFLPIPDPGVKKAPDLGFRIRNPALKDGQINRVMNFTWLGTWRREGRGVGGGRTGVSSTGRLIHREYPVESAQTNNYNYTTAIPTTSKCFKILVRWIWLKASGSRRAKITHTNRKKLIYSIFWSAGCSFFRAEGFSCSLEVFYEGLGISKLQFMIKNRYEKIFSCILFP